MIEPDPIHPPQRRLRLKDAFPTVTNVPMRVFATTVDGDHASHDHEFMEIVLILDGEGFHVCQAGSEWLTPGDVIVLRPGAWHGYRQCRGLLVYNCCLGLQIFSRELSYASQHPVLNYLFWVGPLSDENRGVLKLHLDAESTLQCVEQFDALAASIALAADPCAALELMGRLMLALTTIARHVKPVHTSDLQAPAAHSAVVECRQLLEEECDRDWTLEQLARRCHVAPAYLVRIFKQGTGLSPIAFLNRCRAERAATLLLRTSKSISDIGEEVGWPDASYFSRCFKKCFDMTATEYRERFSNHETAGSPRSPVRIRIASTSGSTNTLPSPS